MPALDALAHLVDRSLLVREAGVSGTRYRMLETLRAFGHDRLVQADQLATTRARHLAWAAALAAGLGPRIDGPDQEAVLKRLDGELDNFRAALGWAVDRGAGEAGTVLATSLFRFWWMRSPGEGRAWLGRLLEGSTHAGPSLARARFVYGALLTAEGKYEAGARELQHSAAAFGAADDSHGAALARHWLARAGWRQIPADALRVLLEECLRVFRDARNEPLIAQTLVLLTAHELEFGSPDGAFEYLDELGQLSHRLAAPQILAHWAEITAFALCKKGEMTPVPELLREALEHYDRIRNRNCASHCFETVAFYLAQSGRPADAVTLVGGVERARDDLGITVPPYELFLHDHPVRAIAAALPSDDVEVRLSAGREKTYEALLAEAMDLLGHADEAPLA
jgi:non-specific serine/threonine protein kinase